jgi:hypothetical protein
MLQNGFKREIAFLQLIIKFIDEEISVLEHQQNEMTIDQEVESYFESHSTITSRFPDDTSRFTTDSIDKNDLTFELTTYATQFRRRLAILKALPCHL